MVCGVLLEEVTRQEPARAGSLLGNSSRHVVLPLTRGHSGSGTTVPHHAMVPGSNPATSLVLPNLLFSQYQPPSVTTARHPLQHGHVVERRVLSHTVGVKESGETVMQDVERQETALEPFTAQTIVQEALWRTVSVKLQRDQVVSHHVKERYALTNGLPPTGGHVMQHVTPQGSGREK